MVAVPASSIGTTLGMLIGPSKTRRQHIAGRWIAIVLGLWLPWSGYKAAEYFVADLGLTTGEFASSLIVTLFASFVVTLVVCAVWWAAVNVEIK
jgi:hypothetical protein